MAACSMSSFPDRLRHIVLIAGAALLLAGAGPAPQEASPVGHYGYGRAPTAAEIAGWAIAVRPDGQGLPAGKGSVDEGANIFAEQCATRSEERRGGEQSR